jgi:hypothetical protein
MAEMFLLNSGTSYMRGCIEVFSEGLSARRSYSDVVVSLGAASCLEINIKAFKFAVVIHQSLGSKHVNAY